jgi:flagellar basal-body rod modification protein FlgD
MSRIASNLDKPIANVESGTLPTGGLNNIDVTKFLDLMMTELRNQDPLNPTDNAQLMEQIGQLRSITANDQLMTTLSSFATTQEFTTASSLIGKNIKGLDREAKEVNGAVSSVSVKIDEKDRSKRQVQVHVGSQIVDIKNVREIVEN